MVALARELGAACPISVARLRPVESDVRGMSSTRSKTTGAVRQVWGDAEVGFRGLGWVPLRGAICAVRGAVERRLGALMHGIRGR